MARNWDWRNKQERIIVTEEINGVTKIRETKEELNIGSLKKPISKIKMVEIRT